MTALDFGHINPNYETLAQTENTCVQGCFRRSDKYQLDQQLQLKVPPHPKKKNPGASGEHHETPEVFVAFHLLHKSISIISISTDFTPIAICNIADEGIC